MLAYVKSLRSFGCVDVLKIVLPLGRMVSADRLSTTYFPRCMDLISIDVRYEFFLWTYMPPATASVTATAVAPIAMFLAIFFFLESFDSDPELVLSDSRFLPAVVSDPSFF